MIRRYSVTVAGQAHAVEVEDLPAPNGAPSLWRVVVGGRERRLEVRAGQGTLSWLEGAAVVQASIDGALPRPTVALRRQVIPVEVTDGRAAALAQMTRDRHKAGTPVAVRAPIPGRVVRVMVKPGDVVAAGRGVVVLEAMKMENELRAPRDGTVKVVSCAEGSAVETGQTLVTLE
jgi:biotin carboxyl carrier protein